MWGGMFVIQVPAGPAPARVPCYGRPTGGVQTRALGPRSRSAFSPEVVVDYVVVGGGRGVPAVQNELVIFVSRDSCKYGADYHWPQKSAARTAAAFKSREAAMENFIVTVVRLIENLESRIAIHFKDFIHHRKYGNTAAQSEETRFPVRLSAMYRTEAAVISAKWECGNVVWGGLGWSGARSTTLPAQ